MQENFNDLSIEENADYIRTQLGIYDKNLSAQEEKEIFKKVFRPKLISFKQEVSKIPIGGCHQRDLNGYIFEYCFHMAMNAYFESKSLTAEKRQHFIPKAYLKGFASDGKLVKSTKAYKTHTNMNDDFRAKTLDENLYTNLGEELLSKVEGDFSSLDLDQITKNGVNNIYEHIVLSAFFALLFIRVPNAIKNNPSGKAFHMDTDFYSFVGAFGSNDILFMFCDLSPNPSVSSLNIDTNSNVPKRYTVKFSQTPMTSFTNYTSKPSFIGPLNKDYIIIFLNPKTPNINMQPLVMKQYGFYYNSIKEDTYTYYNPNGNSLPIIN